MIFVHPQGLCESVHVGPGTRIWAFAHVMQGARVGADCNVCDHVFIETGAIVGDRCTIKNGVMIWDKVVIETDVFVGPGVIFTNDKNPRAEIKKDPSLFKYTVVRKGATIGAGAVIVCGITIGRYAFVGAGAVVTRDVPAHALMAGNPARRAGWMCVCGNQILSLGRSRSCVSCKRVFGVYEDGLEQIP